MNNRNLFIALFAGVFSVSCDEFIQIAPPENQVVSAAVFTSDATAMSALNGLYAQSMRSNFFLLNGALSIYGGLSADELIMRTSPVNRLEFQDNNVQVGNSENEYRFWRQGYTLIYHANALIEGVQEGESILSKTTSDQILGESLFFRALCYFYLTNLYDSIPLVLGTDSYVNSKKERTIQNEIYQQIEEDLLNAETLLENAYPMADRSRPNKHVVQALLARIYLYREQWDKALNYADKVIESPLYTLEDDLDQVFRAESQEVIWQLFPVNESFKATAEAQDFLTTESESSLPTVLINPVLLARFEPGDKRLEHWVSSKTYQDITYWSARKYKVRRGSDAREEYNVLFRLAEQYFIRAEAKFHSGELDGVTENLNSIRQRSGLPTINTTDRTVLQTVLIHEKAIEFFAEVGHRWFDLKRWQMADEVMEAVKGENWQPTDIWYPIPQGERDVNPYLTQNPGYE